MSSLNATLSKLRVVPVIAIDNPEDIIPLGDVLVENGLPVAEITYRTSAATEAIKLLRETQPEMLIGAGTVLNAHQAEAAQKAGATFAVSPGLNPNTVKACQSLNFEILPGINSPTNIESALELGINTLKFFPAEASGGINMVKSLLAPYGDVSLVPTGGISAKNINEYLSIPRVIACGGTWMVDKKLIDEGRWDELAKRVREAVSMTQ
ncbi:bifunctional 4-hydroxy-2-oxoglutarate aldolase/2-dehydro-3-deoxy-phosphogluconate aldolase [Grimontia kaedaensis]|uniref:Bifunctional 4-hydroxy-2-oxoglutarate aldolase/2-dehydro-3-deoxy-phosphogluconate aldolase n=1 Tax=Grimontia kaedaensis TaxID=2872157 RepID=A0ABY4WZC6_9GAMM|nr:bifunctional 4-hydroxy-2-oxoglutarate aldolase/2-dehydro-3-deoxy-phosphogluconate aldolase [Grimontia kaedaensis]USH04336.1 bifunctional 4-hydroxy-2-oxoglutarate aldolase/2-dehydro-3-deoxy-phosphogluconate aldolase [Grimontia kaedaensis]